jgi:hypothetical protein
MNESKKTDKFLFKVKAGSYKNTNETQTQTKTIREIIQK